MNKTFLYRPAFASLDNEMGQVYELPSIKSEDIQEKLRIVFSFNERSELGIKKFIYLDQNLNEFKNYNNYSIIELLNSINTFNLTIRKHPRSTSNYDGFDIDKTENLWEPECISNISGEHILMSRFSMAQFSPKLLADKEPCLIFLYKALSKDLHEIEIKNCDRLVNRLCQEYSVKEKIYVPESVEGIKTIIDGIIKGGD